MGVDTKYVLMIGVKTEYDTFGIYKSKNSSNYLEDKTNGLIEKYNQILFEDYLPEKYKVYNDGMCGEYCYIGEVLDSKEYLDEIRDFEFTPQKLQEQIDKVVLGLEASQIKVNKEDIKLHIFVHFS